MSTIARSQVRRAAAIAFAVAAGALFLLAQGCANYSPKPILSPPRECPPPTESITIWPCSDGCECSLSDQPVQWLNDDQIESFRLQNDENALKYGIWADLITTIGGLLFTDLHEVGPAGFAGDDWAIPIAIVLDYGLLRVSRWAHRKWPRSRGLRAFTWGVASARWGAAFNNAWLIAEQ